ncbi:esterase-like activity of phytase family protein [Teichococcus oryzae]|uniref:Esterase-like activity of phytase family protein n=1 Tax=Teichococcus oryzae TaxID=1608942 RepID=A0A5B2TJ57_9PROT|nr:esterase-like activity of phytase family protein [Pseudoroseomonas oryzae]KAA2214537.1 esterase-like activity of phytase family protein [Pseudoroseomonas oryzae]
MIRSRRRALLLGALALGGLGSCALLRGGDPATPAAPISLPPDSLLVPRGRLLLDRHAMGLGGLSGLHVGDDLSYTAISDLGRWVLGRLVPGPDGVPAALEDVRSLPFRQDFPLPLPRPLMRDAESLARLPDGTWLVGFERWHRICTYAAPTARCEPVLQPPPGLEEAPPNGGLESLAVLADGSWLAITEGLEAPEGTLRSWIGRPGTWMPLRYRPSAGFVPTDVAPLPDGGALVVERSFSLLRGGFRGMLRRIPAAQLARPVAGALLEPETLIRPDDLPPDNWEGVSAFRHRGELWVALQVDDNEMFFQQGQLLFFSFRH